MLTNIEVLQMKANAKIHVKVFAAIRKTFKVGTTAVEIDKICGEIAKEHGVFCGFKGVYGFPNNICISVNDVVVHGRARTGITFQEGDLVTFDFGIKDKKLGINTDAAISLVCGGDNTNPKAAKLIQANKDALYAGIKMARVGNTVGDISAAIQHEIESAGYKVVRDLTGHAIGKELHEKPYIPNFGKAGTGVKLKKGMTLAIEPILGETSGQIVDEGDWEIYIKDGSLGCQYEHTILITDGEAEIII